MTADEHSQLRASDVEREWTIGTLREAAGEGRLTLDELSQRVERALAATTRGELELVVRDLPAAPAGARELMPTAGQVTVYGDVRRAGEWLVPAHSEWHTRYGDVVLDLRRARFAARIVEIDARSDYGDIELLVPDGIGVELRAGSLSGSVRQEAGAAVEPGAPRVILTGGTSYGSVRVRTRRRRERLIPRLWRGGTRG
ncbi:MAG TPA: DUF1707 domain-containing protein, partial [Solirubrobacteraceae bacterium]|nr:DUF1707 domain-containing protein [Solirubrobacteraceae bacterium]